MQFNASEEASSTSGASFIHSSHQVQATPGATSIPHQPPFLCPACQRRCGRRQELRRHLLSFHLPFWIFCPYLRCPWRGHRVEDLRTHLDHQQCGPEPNRTQYEIYDSDLVVGWILDGDASVEIVADYALEFVGQRAWELQMTEEWENLWGH